MHIDLIMKICGIVWIGSGKLGDLFIEFFCNWSWQVWFGLFEDFSIARLKGKMMQTLCHFESVLLFSSIPF